MLQAENTRPRLGPELRSAPARQAGELFVKVPDFASALGIARCGAGNHAGLGTVAWNATERGYAEPGPARAGPDFEHDRTGTTLAPKARVEGSCLIPRSGRDWWPHPERPTLALLRLFGFVFLLTCSPFFERGEEGASRAERGIDSSASEHSRDIWREIGEWHDRIGVGLRCMRELLQGREGPLIVEGKNTFLCLD